MDADEHRDAVALRWQELVSDVLAAGIATYGNQGGPQRAFGATSLKTDGKIFAMLVKGRLIVKLSAARVTALVESGAGKRFDPGHGRIQKEWLEVARDEPARWQELATESEAYVAKRDR